MQRRAQVMPELAATIQKARSTPRKRRHARRLESPRLSVIIVNFHQWEATAELVRQILRCRAARQGAVEVVVVDNNSPRHPLAAQMRRWPGLSLRRWGRNRGFARAVNEGCRLSRGQWLLLLNPDLTMTRGFLDGVLKLADQLADSEPRAGVVGFQLLNSDGSPQLSSGAFPTLAGTLAGLLRPRAARKYRLPRGRNRSAAPWVTGCCLLARKECLQDLGGLDESFFLYYEDVDLCRRARANGWSVLFEPKLRAIHHHPLHQRPVPPALRLITRHSLLTYSRRHWPRWQFAVLTAFVGLEAWVRKLRARCRGHDTHMGIFDQLGQLASDLWQGKRGAARRRVEAISRLGDPRVES